MTQQDITILKELFIESESRLETRLSTKLEERLSTRLEASLSAKLEASLGAKFSAQLNYRFDAFRDEMNDSFAAFRGEINNSIAVLEEHIYNRIDLGIEAIRIVADYVKSEPSVPERLTNCEAGQRLLRSAVTDHTGRISRLESRHRQA